MIWKRWVSWATEKRPTPIFPMSRRPDGLRVGSAGLAIPSSAPSRDRFALPPDVVEQVGKSVGCHAHAIVFHRQRVEPGSIGLYYYLFRIGVIGVRHELSYRRPRLPVDAVSDAGKNPFVCPQDSVDRGCAGAAFNVGSKVGVRLASQIVHRAHRSLQLRAWRRSSACRRGRRTATIHADEHRRPRPPWKFEFASSRGGAKW